MDTKVKIIEKIHVGSEPYEKSDTDQKKVIPNTLHCFLTSSFITTEAATAHTKMSKGLK
jgi:hypothetical protein